MRRHFLALVVLSYAAIGVAAPPDVVIQDKKIGKQRITTLEPVAPATAPAAARGPAELADPPALLKPAEPEACTLMAQDWKCGRCFTDELTRRWCLISGPAYSLKPPEVKGWLVKGEDGRAVFVTEGARVYVRVK
jgi:hypothetical protein